MKAVVAVMRSGLRLLYSVARDRRMFTAAPPVWRERKAMTGRTDGPSDRRTATATIG